EKSGLMFAARVDDEPGAGFDDDAHAGLAQPAVEPPGPVAPAFGQRIDGEVISRQRQSAIAQLGEDLDGVLHPAGGEAVHVIADEHQGPASRYSNSGMWRRISSAIPRTTNIPVTGQPMHVPFSRTRAHPRSNSRTSIEKPSMSRAGATWVRMTSSTRERKSL